MKSLINIMIMGMLFVAATAMAQSAPGETGVYALTNATVETVANGTLKNATVIIRDGKIAAVGADVTVPADAERIDCTGKTIYPGLIDGGTRLGLVEVNSDPRTRDFNEIGDVIPQMQALTAVNPNSALIPVTRVSGVTTALAVPSGGIIPGTAALIDLYGYTPDQMYAGFKAVVMNFPVTGRRGWWDRRSDEEIEKEVEKTKKELNAVWEQARNYARIDSALAGKSESPGYYPEMEALMPIVRGEGKLMIEVNTAKDIKEAIEWVNNNKLDVIFTGVAEGWRVAEELAKSGIPVITGPVLSQPTRNYDRYDKAYANAGLMQKAGVKVAIRTSEAENVRNLPYHAGFAAAYGMGRENALKSITLIPAEIFGIEERAGSIEVGKAANIFIATGDIFETQTKVEQVFISGWKIPMESRQTELYDEFIKRSPGLSK
ncbi:amidohydrolase family protein [Fulvivirga sedimenti]|uniref:Amidohydrolase family protein n=1 Tax=Fulvivirga sedimenti TaxID=2879465 RepID=A0A9X1L142_9BACT|nr:amidohydrolase family protein [Fulvivirga sedimenti]MCA6075354.1 amidohydrolase family protein [Fulvivirga sedimenti]MCA6076531.1 amidohydrolase family protein [Fulvivirga sedimenti]MCA6077659.1 amidohydrolase family protein [Fulvivirga sedimenti]